MYGDPEHPDRVTRTIANPPYTDEDHALLAALKQYEDALCNGCSQPIVEAWHVEMDGWYDTSGYVCFACTAREGREVAYTHVTSTRPPSKGEMPPFLLGETTQPPAEQPKTP